MSPNNCCITLNPEYVTAFCDAIRRDDNLKFEIADVVANGAYVDNQIYQINDKIYCGFNDIEKKLAYLEDKCCYLEELINNITETISRDICNSLNTLITHTYESNKSIY